MTGSTGCGPGAIPAARGDGAAPADNPGIAVLRSA
jgi:hypothetical protein